ncbi:MAG: TerB family tellurite resistance protein [Rubricella sp.]
MLGDLLKILRGDDAPERMSKADQRLALAALLVRLARSDEHYDRIERDQIDLILSHKYGLGAADAGALRAEGERVEAEAPDTVRFTRVIKDAIPYEERTTIAEALWLVALADGERAPEENAFVRQVVSLIGVSDRDSGLARQRAERS